MINAVETIAMRLSSFNTQKRHLDLNPRPMQCFALMCTPLQVETHGPHRLDNFTSWLWAHVVLALFLIKLTFLLCGSILVLLVFGNQVVHVALSLCELHLVHAFSDVPMQECLAPEHCGKILCHT